MAVNFKDLLSKPADKIEKPKPLPAGSYLGSISKMAFDESKEKKTPFVRFFLTMAAAKEDVDQDLLAGIDLTKKQLRKDYYLTDDAEYRVIELAQSCGHDVEGKSLGEVIQGLQGASVLVEVTQRNSQSGEEIYNDVGKLAGA